MEMKQKVLDGSEQFEFLGAGLSVTVKDFWAWSMSRLIGDGPRGDLAEFIVNTALVIDLSEPKRGWGECDIVYGSKKIEVKCSTYLQAWDRNGFSKPTFSIAKTLNCDIEDTGSGYRYIGRDGSPPQRRSHIYVFCLFSEKDRAVANPMMLDQWDFYIVPTDLLNEKLGDQRSISLDGISRLGIQKSTFDQIKSKIDSISI